MVTHRVLSGVAVAIVTFIAVLSVPGRGFAHPMGNFSINHFSAIAVYPTRSSVVCHRYG